MFPFRSLRIAGTEPTTALLYLAPAAPILYPRGWQLIPSSTWSYVTPERIQPGPR